VFEDRHWVNEGGSYHPLGRKYRENLKEERGTVRKERVLNKTTEKRPQTVILFKTRGREGGYSQMDKGPFFFKERTSFKQLKKNAPRRI